MDTSVNHCRCELEVEDRTYRIITSQYKVCGVYPHDSKAYTEGLVLYEDLLYESTGLCKRSSVRRIEPRTGRVLQKEPVKDLCNEEDCRDGACFAEGLTIFQGEVFQLTRRSHKGFIYNPKNLSLLRQFKYAGEGWGLTHDDRFLIMSDGSEVLQFLDPADNFKGYRITVKGMPEPKQLNELEYVKGTIFANLYPTDSILRIDLQDMKVREQIDLSDIRPKEVKSCDTCDLNGIAYDDNSGHLFVTGKRWPYIFEICLTSMPV
jgi:glutaminyl-peptide cyclotransferase